MPVDYYYETPTGLVVITLTGEPPPAELRFWVDRGLADPALPPLAPVLVRGRGNRTPPSVWEVPDMAELADRLLTRFGRRMGVTSATPGMA